jgi:hypothetical protein
MSVADIERELSEIDEAARIDNVKHANRDFAIEASRADNEAGEGPARAQEIRAEATLYAARKRRRDDRRIELETALAALNDADVSDELTSIATAHGEVMTTAKEALANVNFDALSALEQQISDYLAAEESVRNHACRAADVAKNAGVAGHGLESIYSPALTATYERFEQLKRQISSSSQRLSHDQARLGVNCGSI